MENSNSKQVLLSMIGIAILIIAVVGVSFAFFTYSKTGEKNNVITTGNIEFVFEDATNNVILTNQFPKTADEGIKNQSFNFKVIGNVPEGTNAIKYEVYALESTLPESIDGVIKMPTKKFKDEDIMLYVTGHEGDEPYAEEDENIEIVNGYGNVETGSQAGTSAQGFKIASGTIPNDGIEHKHTYTLTMWVSDKVTISDTDYSKTYRASSVSEGSSPPKCVAGVEEQSNCLKDNKEDDRNVYSDLYYSLKIKVVAGDAIGKIFKNNP